MLRRAALVCAQRAPRLSSQLLSTLPVRIQASHFSIRAPFFPTFSRIAAFSSPTVFQCRAFASAATTHYDTLGVSPTASTKEIKSAYFRKAKLLHPDMNPGDTQAKYKFHKISDAYEVLSDEAKRANYDRSIHSSYSTYQSAGQASAQAKYDEAVRQARERAQAQNAEAAEEMRQARERQAAAQARYDEAVRQAHEAQARRDEAMRQARERQAAAQARYDEAMRQAHEAQARRDEAMRQAAERTQNDEYNTQPPNDPFQNQNIFQDFDIITEAMKSFVSDLKDECVEAYRALRRGHFADFFRILRDNAVDVIILGSMVIPVVALVRSPAIGLMLARVVWSQFSHHPQATSVLFASLWKGMVRMAAARRRRKR